MNNQFGGNDNDFTSVTGFQPMPITNNSEPDFGSQSQPAAQPAPIVEEQPAATGFQPAPIVEEQPATTGFQPAPIVEEPAPVVQEPIAAPQPEPVIEKPAPVVEEPAPAPAPQPEPAPAPQPQFNPYTQPQQNYQPNNQFDYSQPSPKATYANEAYLDELSGSALKWGIISIALSELPVGSILSIVFGSKGLSSAETFNAVAGNLFGKAKVGRILSKVGKILGIVMTAFWAFYFLLIIALI